MTDDQQTGLRGAGPGPGRGLVVESIAVAARADHRGLVRDCPITVTRRLMSYGPTRDPLPPRSSAASPACSTSTWCRADAPAAVREHACGPSSATSDAFLEVVKQVAVTAPDMLAGEAVILWQYLSSLDIVTTEQEHELHEAMLRALVARDTGAWCSSRTRRPAAVTRGCCAGQRAGAGCVGWSSRARACPPRWSSRRCVPSWSWGASRRGWSPPRATSGAGRPSYGTPLGWSGSRAYENTHRIPPRHRRAAAQAVAGGRAGDSRPACGDLRAGVARGLLHA
ncbi:hypothetical protein [Nonomuraea dietziae]|uniref:hypothetical protein n=1 Tax=Nonomuraea dietziae TaxID=65515 RepID=UPI0031DA04D0